MNPKFLPFLCGPLRVLCVLCVFLFPAYSRPNFVLMMADDLGWRDLSCYGSEETATPHLDRLAAQGMRFTDFYAASGVCSPSRACFLTGRTPVRAGVYSWIHESQRMHLRVEETTIAELLQGAGYATAHVGKWHLGNAGGDERVLFPTPNQHGFDHWFATGKNALPSHRNPDNFVRNGTAVGELEGYSCQLVVDEAIGWLESDRDPEKPFYLNVWFHEPHAKVAAPEKYRERHVDTKNPDYYGCIENMDAEVGRLLEKLEAMGVADNTVVLFTSDNGSYMAGSNGPFQGKKTTLWEGGIREPGILRWPGHIEAGSVNESPAGIVDILPTVCEIAGVEAPRDRTLDGVSLLPLFGGKEITRAHPLYWFYNPSRPVCVIREGDFCLIADPDIDLPRQNMFMESSIGDIKAAKLVNFRLFNLRNDPGQVNDLSIGYFELYQTLRDKMVALHAEVVAEGVDWRE